MAPSLLRRLNWASVPTAARIALVLSAISLVFTAIVGISLVSLRGGYGVIALMLVGLLAWVTVMFAQRRSWARTVLVVLTVLDLVLRAMPGNFAAWDAVMWLATLFNVALLVALLHRDTNGWCNDGRPERGGPSQRRRSDGAVL